MQQLPAAGQQPAADGEDVYKRQVATLITVIRGGILMTGGYSLIWPLFGAANQLLAALALLAVCAWLGNVGKNNKLFYLPRCV